MNAQTDVGASLQLGMSRGKGGVYLYGVHTDLHDAPGFPQGIFNIGAEVHQDLVQVRWVCQDHARVLRNVQLYLNGGG